MNSKNTNKFNIKRKEKNFLELVTREWLTLNIFFLYISIGEIENILSDARLELQVCHNYVCHNYLSDYIKFLHMKAKVNTPVLALVSNATNLLNKTTLYAHYSQNSNIFETQR